MAEFSLSIQEERVALAETVEIRDEQEQSTTQRGRKRTRRDDVKCKKRGLRKNAPETSIEEILSKNCCKKACVSKFSQDHLVSIREHFNHLTYDEQNLYLTGLVTRKETKNLVVTIGRKILLLVKMEGRGVGHLQSPVSLVWNIIFEIRRALMEKFVKKLTYGYMVLASEGWRCCVKSL